MGIKIKNYKNLIMLIDVDLEKIKDLHGKVFFTKK